MQSTTGGRICYSLISVDFTTSKNEQDKKKDNVVACANHGNIKAMNK